MAFENGHEKLGGRQKGTPNKKTLIKADDLLLELDVNPIQRLIEIAESDEATIDHKINCYKEIVKYTYPKLKSQDIHIEQYESQNIVEVRIIDTDNYVPIMD
jgi:multidrug resistance efflux pump